MSSITNTAANRVEVDVGNDSAPVVTVKKFADQIREMVSMADQVKNVSKVEAMRQKNQRFYELADQFMTEMRQKIDIAKKRLRHKNNHSLSAVVYPPKMVGNIPSHVFIYGGSFIKKGSEEKRDFQNRDKNFFRKKGYKISLVEELQLETFDRDGLFLLNVSDPSKGYQTRFIVSADTNPEEMKETLWHNQNKIPDRSKIRFVGNNRPRFLVVPDAAVAAVAASVAAADCSCTFSGPVVEKKDEAEAEAEESEEDDVNEDDEEAEEIVDPDEATN